MSSKGKDKKKRSKSPPGSPKKPDDIMLPRSMEEDLAAIEQAVEGHDFGTTEQLNAFLEDITTSGKFPRWVPQTALDKAQELVYDAWEAPNKRQRVKLAREALKICPDCADAYVILAEDAAHNVEEAFEFYGLAVKAGARALGVETFSDLVGHFWGVVRTRPYMRARAGLAQCLCLMERHEGAIEHYWAMLRLNPNDNQGIRYLLATCLLVHLGDIESLLKLLKAYDGDITAAWPYTWALVTFIREGDSPKARRCLKKALKQNPYVAPYLLLERRMPRKVPDHVGFGDESEAVAYCDDFGRAWYKTKDAILWLKSVMAEKK